MFHGGCRGTLDVGVNGAQPGVPSLGVGSAGSCSLG